MATTSDTTSVAAAGKVETCHYHLQVANYIDIHVYPALQLMQAKFLPMKFWGYESFKLTE